MRTVGAPLSRTPNTFAPGSWEPGRFHLSDALLLKGTLVFMAFWRGFDYITPPPALTPVTETMMLAFPLSVWGGAFLVLAAMLTAGLALRIHFLVNIPLPPGTTSFSFAGSSVALRSLYPRMISSNPGSNMVSCAAASHSPSRSSKSGA